MGLRLCFTSSSRPGTRRAMRSGMVPAISLRNQPSRLAPIIVRSKPAACSTMRDSTRFVSSTRIERPSSPGLTPRSARPS